MESDYQSAWISGGPKNQLPSSHTKPRKTPAAAVAGVLRKFDIRGAGDGGGWGVGGEWVRMGGEGIEQDCGRAYRRGDTRKAERVPRGAGRVPVDDVRSEERDGGELAEVRYVRL